MILWSGFVMGVIEVSFTGLAEYNTSLKSAQISCTMDTVSLPDVEKLLDKGSSNLWVDQWTLAGSLESKILISG